MVIGMEFITASIWFWWRPISSIEGFPVGAGISQVQRVSTFHNSLSALWSFGLFNIFNEEQFKLAVEFKVLNDEMNIEVVVDDVRTVTKVWLLLLMLGRAGGRVVHDGVKCPIHVHEGGRAESVRRYPAGSNRTTPNKQNRICATIIC